VPFSRFLDVLKTVRVLCWQNRAKKQVIVGFELTVRSGLYQIAQGAQKSKFCVLKLAFPIPVQDFLKSNVQ
jgi:hypothetical protein